MANPPLLKTLASLCCGWAALSATAGSVSVTVRGQQGQPLVDAVLMLEPVGAKVPVKPMADVEIGQRQRRFEPLVSVVTAGTAVSFPNRDTVRHHVYSFSPAKKFEIKLYVGKPEKPIVFERSGVVVLGCNIHDQMVGWVVVSDTPWWAKTASPGTARWDDVPKGAYQLRAWHPSLPAGSPGLTKPLTVNGSEQLTMDLPAS
jgi:plastocyanin